MHYNKNSNRKQAKTKKGELRWTIANPKTFHGEKAVHMVSNMLIKMPNIYCVFICTQFI